MASEDILLRKIKLYLFRNTREFIRAKKLIHEMAGIDNEEIDDAFVMQLIRRFAPYLKEYLLGVESMPKENVIRHLKREIRIIIVLYRNRLGMADQLNKDPDKEKEIKKHIANWFQYVKNIFIPFSDAPELFIILRRAEELANKNSLKIENIFTNDNYYNMFLRCYYNDKKITKKHFEKLLSPFKNKRFSTETHKLVNKVINERLKEIY
ncbi:hypothetical protein GW950_01900 [Candidatus Wolfebacteria bacterium]|nr:hypothetical protein [Candidatus Wolfebacteria bacterium]